MLLTLKRRWLAEQSTIGELSIDGVFECYTLEDTFRSHGPKLFGRTCIPCGTYRVAITWSPRFQRELPHIMGVPGFAGIRIHPGNTPDDTSGCVLVGVTRGVDSIGQSRRAFEALLEKLKLAHRDIVLTVTVEPASP